MRGHTQTRSESRPSRYSLHGDPVRLGMNRVVLSSHHQRDCIQNHHGNIPLGMSAKVFFRGLTEERRPTSNMGSTIPDSRWNKKRRKLAETIFNFLLVPGHEQCDPLPHLLPPHLPCCHDMLPQTVSHSMPFLSLYCQLFCYSDREAASAPGRHMNVLMGCGSAIE